MADLASIRQRQIEALRRIKVQVPIDIPPEDRGIAYFDQWMEMLTLEAIADGLEKRAAAEATSTNAAPSAPAPRRAAKAAAN